VRGLAPALAWGGQYLRRTLLEPDYPLVAVEVRPQALSVVRLRREGGRVGLGAAASCDVPPGLLRLSITEPNITDAQAFGVLLATLLERAGARQEGPVSLVLPDPVGRVAVLPAAELAGRGGSDLLEMARFRLRRTVPFEIREAQVAVALPPRAGPDTALVATIFRPVLQDYEAAFVRFGLVPRLVELDSLALLDLVGPSAGDRVFLNWEDTYASLVLTRGGWPLLVRTLADAAASPEALPREVGNTLLYYRERLGGPGLTAAVVRSAALPSEEAVSVLEEPLGLRPSVLEPWSGLGGGEPAAGQAVAGALAAALRGARRWAA
jgi:Tfp pilus assembly PilM family ATPase